MPRWLRAALLAGLVYLAIGLGFAALARQFGATWRWPAWGASAVVFAMHIRFELRLQSPTLTTAFHAALAVALGAFGLAVAATVHAATTSSYRGAFVLALAAWPVMMGTAAFVAALVLVASGHLLRTAQQKHGRT